MSAVAPDGALWIGTLEGIARFDGQASIPYTSENTSGAPIRHADTIAVALDGTVWVGGDWEMGLRRLDGKDSQDMNQELGSNAVSALAISPDGTLSVGTHTGVVHYDGQRWTRFALSNDESIGVSSMVVDSIGGVWVGFSLWMGYSQYLKQEDIREDMAP